VGGLPSVEERALVLPGWSITRASARGTLHIVTRLDRETSGVVVVALHPLAARRYQMAMQNRRVEKTYLAFLNDELHEEKVVEAPLVRDAGNAIAVKRRVALAGEPGAESAQTRFEPIIATRGLTLARVFPLTGRTHQIRVHAAHLGHAIVGDKLYGPDETLYLEFAKQGWTARHAAALPMRRQALHASRLRFLEEGLGEFMAPPPADLVEFAREKMGLDLARAWPVGNLNGNGAAIE